MLEEMAKVRLNQLKERIASVELRTMIQNASSKQRIAHMMLGSGRVSHSSVNVSASRPTLNTEASRLEMSTKNLSAEIGVSDERSLQ